MHVIRHIVGQTLQVYDPSESNMTPDGPKELLEFDIKKGADILLNGQKVKIAELQIGDAVNVGGTNTRGEGYSFVEAIRDEKVIEEQRSDMLGPRVLRLQEAGHDAPNPPLNPNQPPVNPSVAKTVYIQPDVQPSSPGGTNKIPVESSMVQSDPNDAEPDRDEGSTMPSGAGDGDDGDNRGPTEGGIQSIHQGSGKTSQAKSPREAARQPRRNG